MSTVDNNQSLNNILNKLGVQKPEEKSGQMARHSGQEDF